jgi:hypothetical protein
MSDVQKDLEGFYQFANSQIVVGTSSRSLSELFDEWRSQQLTSQELAENALAVKASLRDIEAGEAGREFEAFSREFRTRNNIMN